MNIPENLRYTKDHEWVRVEGNEAYVGITDFAQGELDRQNVNIELKDDVKNALKGAKVTSQIVKEQINKLNRIQKYIGFKYADYVDKLEELAKPEKKGQKVAEELREQQKLRKRKTIFFDSNNVFPSGTILGDEKSGSSFHIGPDVIPPTFTITVAGA